MNIQERLGHYAPGRFLGTTAGQIKGCSVVSRKSSFTNWRQLLSVPPNIFRRVDNRSGTLKLKQLSNKLFSKRSLLQYCPKCILEHIQKPENSG